MNNEKNYWAIGAIIVLVLAVGGIWIYSSRSTYTDNGNPTTTSEIPSGSTMKLPYGPVTLNIGNEAVFSGITIRPISIVEDSRCPIDVTCIQAGTVRVNVEITVQSTGKKVTETLTLGATTDVDTFIISLVSVEPATKAGTIIKTSDYKLKFEVHQNGSKSPDLEGLEAKG